MNTMIEQAMRFAPELALFIAMAVGVVISIATQEAVKAIPKHLIRWTVWTLPGVVVGFAIMTMIGGIDRITAVLGTVCSAALAVFGHAAARHEKARLAEQARDRWKRSWGPPE